MFAQCWRCGGGGATESRDLAGSTGNQCALSKYVAPPTPETARRAVVAKGKAVVDEGLVGVGAAYRF